jgi:hypothetical protein
MRRHIWLPLRLYPSDKPGHTYPKSKSDMKGADWAHDPPANNCGVNKLFLVG